MTTTAQGIPERFAPYLARGERLLSTEGLYNPAVVERICTAMPSIPASEFAEGNPKTVVFNFLAKLVALADQVGAVSGNFYLARMLEVEYPLADISRVATHLVNLSLHPALDPLSAQGQQMMMQFAQVNDTSDDAIRAVAGAILWLRSAMVERYAGFNTGESFYVTTSHVRDFKEKVEDQNGASGMLVGAAAQQASLMLGMLQGVGQAGKLEVDGDCNMQAPTDAEPHMLQAALNQSARLHFGAKGCYLDWPAGTDAGDCYELEGPVESDQNGVLWRWDGAAMLPMVSDQATASDELTTQWQIVTNKLREEGYPIALAYHPIV